MDLKANMAWRLKMEDSAWFTLLLLVYMANGEGVDVSKITRGLDDEYIKTCPNVEWEEDMGKTIPFCKINGQFCNRQCRRES